MTEEIVQKYGQRVGALSKENVRLFDIAGEVMVQVVPRVKQE